MKQFRRVRFVKNNFKGGEDHLWNVFSRIVGESKSEQFACQVPDFSRVVFTTVK
jgi:hypothetical protein